MCEFFYVFLWWFKNVFFVVLVWEAVDKGADRCHFYGSTKALRCMKVPENLKSYKVTHKYRPIKFISFIMMSNWSILFKSSIEYFDFIVQSNPELRYAAPLKWIRAAQFEKHCGRWQGTRINQLNSATTTGFIGVRITKKHFAGDGSNYDSFGFQRGNHVSNVRLGRSSTRRYFLCQPHSLCMIGVLRG